MEMAEERPLKKQLGPANIFVKSHIYVHLYVYMYLVI